MPKSGSIKKLPSVSFKYISFPIKRSLSNRKKNHFPNCENYSNYSVIPLYSAVGFLLDEFHV